MQTPAQRYRPSQRPYQTKIEPWPYPENLELLSVDANGMIRWKGGRYFVCEALVHHQVAVESIGRGLLVRFRNMYIREIDLETGRTLPFIHSASNPL